jgi:hypothetical protein
VSISARISSALSGVAASARSIQAFTALEVNIGSP